MHTKQTRKLETGFIGLIISINDDASIMSYSKKRYIWYEYLLSFYSLKQIMIENITCKDDTFAIILRTGYREDGIYFMTKDNFTQQLGYINRPEGYVILPHVHNPVAREVQYTKEVLFIKSGKVRVDFYDNDHNYIESRILYQGDVVLLAYGGHGFEMLENSEIIEVKQGPYVGEADKTRFSPVSNDRIILK